MPPTKLGPHVIEAFRQVLANDDTVLMCTDDDLLYMLNKQLQHGEQVSYRSFQRYKALALECGMDYEYIDPDNVSQSFYFDPIYRDLYMLFRDALIRQKEALMNRLIDSKNYFELRKWQWILERKFREWNLRYTTVEAERSQKSQAREEMVMQEEADLEVKDNNRHDENEYVPTIIPVYITPEGHNHVETKYRPYIDPKDLSNLPPRWNMDGEDGPEY